MMLPFSAYVSSHRVSGQDPRLAPALLAQISDGHATARICVANDGRVSDVRVLHASPGLAEPVQSAVRTWKYRPFMSQGKTVPVCFDMPFEFRRQG